ncbi:nitrogenase molybdenum-iron protein subunit beta [Acetivibrio clariflavus]|uniref:Nitrogenase molybdenum-iron protein beta chain n=1 Tax=Acetivibrio clariflavus (strain DSM 19732 / NBRC 101661 / EBR45) TaxID=720554 RepID=G8LZM1_ACECE|nr:nitrogenase molybdenum-iron protein subunit beta [Acetivibrio clariflavus]AEV67922.1 Mo-nitrogenase MoFe protein subunit NifK [Acetivibrio clariflavus DSM 19732]HOQ00576.1 nitrogenase molybdenum-iron protein subunit beta [Acetivibrio clariflavus]
MLDFTPKEYVDRKGLVINPAKTCQPVGAMYAALGIHKCLPHSHGSQGCCAYHRKFLTRHFRDPVMASTSSFTEGAAVFGGGTNLKTAIKNVFSIYNPDIIAIHTTCLSETIGDDIPAIILQSQVPEGKIVIHANTPSYVGSHITGFSNMVKGMVKYLSKNSGVPNGKINVIPGFVNPADMREMKRILKAFGAEFIMFPDTSGVLDAPMTGKYEMYPSGGTKVEELIDTGNSKATIALGSFASADGAFELDKKCKVPYTVLKTPIGIEATDRFLMEISKITGKEIPYELEEERGQVVDVMVDCHYHYHGKKVAIFGDPDLVIALTEFAISLGMIPKYVLTGTPGDSFEKEVGEMLKAAGVDGKVKAAGDLFTLHQWIKEEPVDLLMGTTHGKYIARAEDIPFVRIGFPILDRSVHSYMPLVGYRGAMRIIEMISNTLLDRQDRDAADEDLELIM